MTTITDRQLLVAILAILFVNLLFTRSAVTASRDAHDAAEASVDEAHRAYLIADEAREAAEEAASYASEAVAELQWR